MPDGGGRASGKSRCSFQAKSSQRKKQLKVMMVEVNDLVIADPLG
jgi:hypothetical protein